MTEPTDVEIESAWTEATGSSILPYPDDMLAFARAVLAKWGTPPAVAGEPVAQWQKRHPTKTEGKWENTNEADAKWWRDNSQGWEIRALYTTPQPTQAQAGAVPLTDEQWQRIADLTDSILTRATKDEIERVIGIKGGQHG